MAIKFSERVRGTHPYFCEEKAAHFLALTFQLLQQDAGIPYTILCRNRTRLTVKQMFAYGRQYIVHTTLFDSTHPHAPLQTFADLVKPIRIGDSVDQPHVLSVTAPHSVHVMYLQLPPTPLFSAFTVIYEWLRMSSDPALTLAIYDVDPVLRPAFDALLRYRPSVEGITVTDNHVIINRRQTFFSNDA
jgi:hypothetical protein